MSSFAGTRILGNLAAADYPPGVFDLIRGFVQGNVILRNETAAGAAPAFREAKEHEAGWAYGPTLGDFDGDGRLDLYCPAGYQSVSRSEPDG
ncbi:MAG: VCBS repeat-containing protein [Planctomycetes bacterium]|nr:VCBS repeat-containing protein [Planctomycetota bacterium]